MPHEASRSFRQSGQSSPEPQSVSQESVSQKHARQENSPCAWRRARARLSARLRGRRGRAREREEPDLAGGLSGICIRICPGICPGEGVMRWPTHQVGAIAAALWLGLPAAGVAASFVGGVLPDIF